MANEKEPRWANEVLSDNTHKDICKQCKTCRWWGNGEDYFSNKYDKTSCDKYPYPAYKPMFVVNNEHNCTFYERRKE
jgi:hypothetical protein